MKGRKNLVVNDSKVSSAVRRTGGHCGTDLQIARGKCQAVGTGFQVIGGKRRMKRNHCVLRIGDLNAHAGSDAVFLSQLQRSAVIIREGANKSPNAKKRLCK